MAHDVFDPTVATSTAVTTSPFEPHGTIVLDDVGNPVCVVQKVSGGTRCQLGDQHVGHQARSTLARSSTSLTEASSGTAGRINVPHGGVVFFDVGRFIIDFDVGLVIHAGHHHSFINEDYAQICSLLS